MHTETADSRVLHALSSAARFRDPSATDEASSLGELPLSFSRFELHLFLMLYSARGKLRNESCVLFEDFGAHERPF